MRRYTKGKYYIISGRYAEEPDRVGQYELTTALGEHCFFMEDTTRYEYFTDRIIKESQ